MFITNNHASFHLQRMENLVNYLKVSKYYAYCCTKVHHSHRLKKRVIHESTLSMLTRRNLSTPTTCYPCKAQHFSNSENQNVLNHNLPFYVVCILFLLFRIASHQHTICTYIRIFHSY